MYGLLFGLLLLEIFLIMSFSIIFNFFNDGLFVSGIIGLGKFQFLFSFIELKEKYSTEKSKTWCTQCSNKRRYHTTNTTKYKSDAAKGHAENTFV